MAVQRGNSVSIQSYDMTHVLQRELISDIFESDFKTWKWIDTLDSAEAHEYYFSHVRSAEKEILGYSQAVSNKNNEALPKQINIDYYVSSNGSLGEFILQTRQQHGDIVAFYALQIATTDTDATHKNYNRSDPSKKSLSYEYHLAHFLYFQHINAGDYITGNTNKKLKTLVENFSTTAKLSLEDIRDTGDTARKMLSESSEELARGRTRNKARALTVLRRYRRVFSTVRQEAHAAKIAAKDDLTSAFETYHAQVDLKSSIVYWNDKVIQHNKSKWRWLIVVIASVILTFASPIYYYSIGGASALSEKNNESKVYTQPPPQPTDISKDAKPSNTSESSIKDSVNLSHETLQKVVIASGIADLTGAALIVALMSVLLRLSLRQYNTYMFLGNDAEERVTMLKTYLALSNEGKLTSDGDMKLVLEALFRPSQSGSIPESTPATPIELVIKAITERK